MGIVIKKSVFYALMALAAVGLVGGWYILFSSAPSTTATASPPPDEESEEELRQTFASLSGAQTNVCGGTSFMDRIEQMPGDARLQGSCCSPMDFHRYQEQLEGLRSYAHIPEIPPDPYDISVAHAQRLLDYQKTIQLDSAQQAVYNAAMELSQEGGPCCCKCWRWYAFEGLAKHLIVEYGFTAEEVADVWDLEDGCGGTGHAHGTGEGGHV